MGSFSFDIGGKKVSASTKKIRGASGHRFEASGKCPFCNKSFSAGNMPGAVRSESEVEASLRFTLKRHYNTQHKG